MIMVKHDPGYKPGISSSRTFIRANLLSPLSGSGSSDRRTPIPKNTEAEYIPDILHVPGSGSLLQIVKV
jgi:hypothetical protein